MAPELPPSYSEQNHETVPLLHRRPPEPGRARPARGPGPLHRPRAAHGAGRCGATVRRQRPGIPGRTARGRQEERARHARPGPPRPGRIPPARAPGPGPVPWRAHGLGDPEGHRTGRQRDHPDRQRTLRGASEGRTCRQAPGPLAPGGDQCLRTMRALDSADDPFTGTAGRLAQGARRSAETDAAPGGRTLDQPCQAREPGVSDRAGGRLVGGRSGAGQGGGVPCRAPGPAGAAYRNRASGGGGLGFVYTRPILDRVGGFAGMAGSSCWSRPCRRRGPKARRKISR